MAEATGEAEAIQPTRASALPPLPRDAAARLVAGTHPAPHEILGPHLLGPDVLESDLRESDLRESDLRDKAAHDPNQTAVAEPDAVPREAASPSTGVVIRVLRPSASGVWVVLADGTRQEMAHEYEGIWGVMLPTDEVPDYRLAVSYDFGDPIPADDPYRFLPTVRELDQHLIAEGRHERLWEVLGSRVHEYDSEFGPVRGVSFAVWAPNALGVRVVGDFNYWDGTSAPMRRLGDSGVWELFVPEIGPGNHYKFAILGPDGQWRLKADPMARQTEPIAGGASIVNDSEYRWQDAEWMATRAENDPHLQPMSVMEVHLGSWRQGLSYVELAEQLAEYASLMGYTHVELLPVMEHPYGGSWGYQVTSYYAPTARFGTPDEFRHLVDRLHQAGIGVILDWVPGHFPKDDWALARFDGTPLYEHADPRRGEQLDWGTYVFDFGRPQVRNFLVANAVYWASEFHVDGIRVDAVASMLYLDYSREPGEWTPNIYGGRENLEAVQFLQEMNATVYRACPGVVTIAEESTAWPGVTRATHLGGLGFGMKWNMGWMHDTLGYMGHEPVHRRFHHHAMTFSLMYAWSEQFVLPISHDEVVHGKGSLINKMAGEHDAKFANLRAVLAYMWAHPGKQLLFMGQEFAQWREWSEERSLDWYLIDDPYHLGVQRVVQRLNELYVQRPALWEQDFTPDGFEWIDANDAENNVFSFIRWSSDGTPLVCVSNFAGVPHDDYRVGLPWAGDWQELINTDAIEYAGFGVGNLGRVHAVDEPWHGRPASVTLNLPALSTLWLAPAPPEPDRPKRAVLGREGSG